MSEQWLRDYTVLALRIDKVMRKVTELPYVDGYYGPRAWKAQVEIESEVAAKRPFHDIYLCTYYYGKQLLAPLLSGPQRQSAFRRVLTEQLIPSDLV